VLTLALLLGGLLVIRWVGSANAEVSFTGQARVPVAAPPLEAPAEPETRSALAPPTSQTDDLMAASQEGIRLGILALAEDDLRAARDFFFLATEAAPENPTAADRLRQAETALTIESRTTDLAEAVADLGELRRLAPGAPSLTTAYVTALVRAAREASSAGDGVQASQFCAEARRWLPNRPDVATCLSRPAATSGIAPSTPAPNRLPTATLASSSAPLLPAMLPTLPGAIPTQASATVGNTGESDPAGERLTVDLRGACVPAAAGAKSMQVSGSVTAGGAVAVGATVEVRITDPSGRVLDASALPVASPRFTFQRTTAGGGPRTVTATASGPGYAPGVAAVTLSC
jgi:hypothetical protein